MELLELLLGMVLFTLEHLDGLFGGSELGTKSRGALENSDV